MANIIRFSPKDAKAIGKFIEQFGMSGYIVFENDLEKESTAKKSVMNNGQVMEIIPEAKSIFANVEEDEEDSFSTLSLYSTYQPDPFDIIMRGTKREILLIPKQRE